MKTSRPGVFLVRRIAGTAAHIRANARRDRRAGWPSVADMEERHAATLIALARRVALAFGLVCHRATL